MMGESAAALRSAPQGLRKKRSFWSVSAAEARMHALILAIVLWTLAIAILTLGTAYRDPFDQLKWTDFIQFYTLGNIARNGPSSALYDSEALHQRQVTLVPESAPEHYLTPYPPQIALVFGFFSQLSYHGAAILWTFVNAAVYVISVIVAWRTVRPARLSASLVAASAAAFPPFWSQILHGQVTSVPIIAFTCGALALYARRNVAAGFALGLLFIKPQFGVMLAVVVLSCREWRIFAGLMISACVQLIVVSGLLGHTVILDYLQSIPRLLALRTALEPRVAEMHSLSVVTRLLPGHLGTVAWFAVAVAVSWMAVQVWRSGAPTQVRMGSLAVCSMLVNPHVMLYDLAVLAGPLLALTGWLEMQSQQRSEACRRWRAALYALFVLLLFPSARVIGLQLSPFVLLVLTYTVWHTACRAQVECVGELMGKRRIDTRLRPPATDPVV